MYRNAVTLPIIALLFALAGAGVLALDLNSKQVAEQVQPLVIDGKIAEREYANHLQIDGIQMDLYWSVKDDLIDIGIRAPTKGWVAIGFDPEGPFMKGADIAIGYVQDGQLFLRDSYANVPTGHQADTELGGRDDILEKAGSQSEDVTVIEFSRKLNTGDSFDKPIVKGKPMPVMLAYGAAADFTSYHGKTRTRLQELDFFPTSAAPGGAAPFWPGLPSHLEAYELGLIAWVILLSIFGVQGLISIWLEGRELEVGSVTCASESLGAIALAALLALLELWWVVQFVHSVYGGGLPAMTAIYAALLAFTLAIFLLIYRRFFVPTETIVGDREDHVPW